MAKKPIRQLSARTEKDLKRVLDLSRQDPTFRIGDIEQPAQTAFRTVRWVRTLESATAPLFRVQVEFGDLEFDDTASGVTTETFTPYDPQVTRYALDRDGVTTSGDVVKATLHHGRWYINQTGGDTTNCHVARFIIVTADASTRSAICLVRSRPAGCTDVPESTLGGTVIEVCDPMGCFFNETADALTGRAGWARYMLPVVANICQPDDNYLVPHWEVFSLCCHLDACELDQ